MLFFFHWRVCAFSTMAFTVLVTCEISTEILPYKTKILIEDLYKKSLLRKGKSIVSDNSHPLSDCFQVLPSGRRFRVPLAKKKYAKTFVPSAIRILNSTKI